MGPIVRLVCGRRTKWTVLVLWLVLAGALGPLAGQLTAVQTNDTADLLPGNAESTQALELQQRLQTADVAPAVIVYVRPSGITAADEAVARADAAELASVDRVTGQIIGPLPADDGQALQLVVPIRMGADGFTEIAGTLDRVREVTGTGTGGLAVHVGGLGGIYADSATAFEGLDTTLLLASVLVVVILLLFIYRSPVLWILPVVSAAIALVSAQAVIYLLAEHGGMTVSGQSVGILTVLVFGAGTDYALLLVARYREELRRHEDRHEAMAVALRRVGPAVVASAATVAAAMLCLFAAQMNSTRGLGPVCAIGIAIGLFAMLTLLPALLVICGRWLFWPVRPTAGATDGRTGRGWDAVGRRVAARPRLVWIGTTLALAIMALGLTQLSANGLDTDNLFVDEPSSVTAQRALGEHFPAGGGQPVVVIGNARAAEAVQSSLAGTPGIAQVSQPVVRDGLAAIEGTLADRPDSPAAERTVERVRATVHAIPGADAKVGGQTAMGVDLNDASRHDNRLIIPLVLLTVLVILALLLRAVVAPLLLVATVVLSFAATLGISALVFTHVFGFEGTDSSFPLFVFVFLVALGVDYNIFLMTRVREEAIRHGTRQGVLTGLRATGGVITSAGLVLAATFAVLATLPLVFFVELGFAVALGVLIDTFIVRSVLVTALTLDLGQRVWWPGTLGRGPASSDIPSDRAEDRALAP
ncbi:MMPL family transporter [Micromonospora sp. NPDC051543]|uniref:MMPL family transporter n=1 Tax=Micromonospora sp. NPDC051543 TaxID=3364287 RepID=UPI00379139D8